MYDKTYFSRDSTTFMPDGSVPGVSVDEESGEAEFDWSEIERVHVDRVPWADHFASDEFFKIPGTVARPIPQEYRFGEDSFTFMKPREELKKAAWSLDNAPWTLGHPDTGMVKNIDDIHGFWSNPRYVDSMDKLQADLFVPVNDSQARKFLEENGDVSVGFYNTISRADQYDGVVGGSDAPDDLDGFQTDIYFDHVASVGVGRCPSGAGCGLHDHAHGHTDSISGSFISGSETTDTSRGTTGAEDFESGTHDGVEWTTDYRDSEGRYFAVAPSENPDDEPKFPINNCNDAKDAWNLRGSGDISISQDSLERRIKRRASELGCDLPSTAQDSVPEGYTVTGDSFYSNLHNKTKTMTEETNDGCPDCGDSAFDGIEISDMTVDFLADQHDGVQELKQEVAEMRDAAETVESVTEALDLDEGQDIGDAVELLVEQRDSLQETVDEYESDEKEKLIDEITDRTERWDADDLAELSLDEVQDKHDLVVELTADERTANSGGSDEADSSSEPMRQTPWE